MSRRRYQPKLGDELGYRELQVVRGLASGFGFKRIAHEHGVSRRTIEHQARYARVKLGAKTNAHLAAVSVRKGLV